MQNSIWKLVSLAGVVGICFLLVLMAQNGLRQDEPPIAETTTATWWPSSWSALMRAATLRMRSKEPTEVPPYFWTMRAMERPRV